MIYSRAETLNDLHSRTTKIVSYTNKKLSSLNEEELNWKLNPNVWSVAECLDHLCLYGEYYIPAMRRAMESSADSSDDRYSSSFIGESFSKSMLPGDRMKLMSSPKDKNPTLSGLRSGVVQRFMDQQEQMLEVIQLAENKNLNKNKVGITIARWFRLRLGDTLRFNTYHNQRHIEQVKRTLIYMKD